ncbi:hypothetical protein FXO37_11211 [Capsicum annuum]|nr:hypothetical protein FXO37_11211 [Capsicum annuum]
MECEETQFFMMSLLTDMEEGCQCYNIQAEQGNSIPPKLSILIEQYNNIFELPTTLPPHKGKFDHRIPLVESTCLVNKRPYRYPGVKKDIIEKLVQEILDQGVIQYSTSPYASPVVLVVSNWPVPNNIKQLRGFLGLAGYYKRFIKGFGSICRPLHDLLKKDNFGWNEECTAAFEKLKKSLISAPVLVMPDYSKLFVVETDASGQGIGAVLMQQGHPVAYISKSLAPKHQAMSVYDRELLALIFVVSNWSHYLLNNPFIIRTDQKALKHLLEQNIHTDFQIAGISKLMAFDFSIEYKKGVDNKCHDQLRWKGRLVVGADQELRKTIIELWHSSSQGGHSGMDTTIKRNKYDAAAYPGLLQPQPIPQGVWTDICLDFIKGLPKVQGKEVILVVVDRLSKYGHFMSLQHPYTAQSVAQTFLDNVFKLHGMPATITSDRHPIFLSMFWQELFTLQGVQLQRSTAYHPLTDRQTEVVNRTLETYLRYFCSDSPKDWPHYLPLAKWWYNTTYHSSIRCSPYERAQQRMKSLADKHRSDRSFEVRDWVYLKLQPYRQISIVVRPNNKLAAKYYGPYPIAAKVGVVAYKLLLPVDALIHHTFHVSQLKRCHEFLQSSIIHLSFIFPALIVHCLKLCWKEEWPLGNSSLMSNIGFPHSSLEDKSALMGRCHHSASQGRDKALSPDPTCGIIRADTSRISVNLLRSISQGRLKGVQAMTTLRTRGRVWRILLELPLEQYHVWMIAWRMRGAISKDMIHEPIEQHRVWMIAWGIGGSLVLIESSVFGSFHFSSVIKTMGGANLDTILEVIMGIRQDVKQMTGRMSKMDGRMGGIDGKMANIGDHLKAANFIPRPHVQTPSSLPTQSAPTITTLGVIHHICAPMSQRRVPIFQIQFGKDISNIRPLLPTNHDTSILPSINPSLLQVKEDPKKFLMRTNLQA